MIKKIFFVAKMVCLLGAISLAFPVLAAWSDVPTGVTPALCPSGTPGCNTPINVSNLTQTKPGVLNLGGLTSGFKAPTVSVFNVARYGLGGTYSFRYTLVINGQEVAGSAPSLSVVSAANQNIKVVLPYGAIVNPLPAGTTQIKIYRRYLTGGWYLLSVPSFSIDSLSGLYYFNNSYLSTININFPYPETTEMNTTINNPLYYKNGTEGANKVLTSNADGLATWATPAGTTGTSLWTTATNGTDIYRNIGNVGIGTTNLGTYKLNVNGNTNITGTLNATSWADTVLVTNLNADLLDGAQSSVAASNNTIVQRSAGGYVVANYFKTTASVTAAPATHFAVEIGNDNYIRWQTPASARISLGLGSLATLSAVSGGTAGTITDNSISAIDLNVLGNGTTNQYLRSDGDGSFTWATPATGGTTVTPTTPTFKYYRCRGYKPADAWISKCYNTTSSYDPGNLASVEATTEISNSYFTFTGTLSDGTDYYSVGRFICPTGTILMSSSVACGNNDGTDGYKDGSGVILQNSSLTTNAICDNRDKRAMNLNVVCANFNP